MSQEPNYINEYPLVTEGLGKCEIHGCDYWGTTHPVWAVVRDARGNITSRHQYTTRACIMCDMERKSSINARLGIVTDKNSSQGTLEQKKTDYISQFEKSKGIKLSRDTIIQFDYADPISVTNVDNMKQWLVQNVGQQINVKAVDTNKYVIQSKNKYMSDEEKNKFLRLKYEIETADLVIIDSLADYEDRDEGEINKMMTSIKDKARLMILTIPESDDRLKEFPSKLKFRMVQAQKLSLSSTGKGIR